MEEQSSPGNQRSRPTSVAPGLAMIPAPLLHVFPHAYSVAKQEISAVYKTFTNESLDDVNGILYGTSMMSSLLFGSVMYLLMWNPLSDCLQADFNNIVCQKFEARKYLVSQLSSQSPNVPLILKNTGRDGSVMEVDIEKELFLSDPEGKCPGFSPRTLELNNCLHDVYKNDPEWFPLASSTYVDPFCHGSGHFLASKEYLEAHVDKVEFRTWAHNKWPGHEYPYDTSTTMAGSNAAVTLALTLFGSLVFHFTVTLSRAREDETGRTLKRFSLIAVPAHLLLFVALMMGVFFTIDFLVQIIRLRVSSFIVSYQMGSLFTISLAIGSTLLTLWASAAFIYSHERVWSRKSAGSKRRSRNSRQSN